MKSLFILGISLFFFVLAEVKIGQHHQNNTHNFLLKVPMKWKALPTDPKEKYVVDKFQSAQSDPDGILCQLEIMVFNATKRVVTENPGISFEGGETSREQLREQLEQEWAERERPTSFDDYLKKQKEYTGITISRRYEIPWKKSKNGKAQVYEYAQSGNSAFGIVACAYRFGKVEYVVQYSVNIKDVQDDRGDRDSYLTSFKTFSLTKDATGIKKEIVDVTKLPPHKRRDAVKKNLPKGWYAMDTKNYVIISNVKNRKLINEIAQHLELIRLEYERVFPPKEKVEALSVVRICANREEYIGYGAPGGSAGYFSPGSKEMVLYDDSKRDKKNTFAVLYHECFHQYTYYSFGELSAHRWYDEGLGDYFAGARLKEGRFKIEKFDWRTETIRKAVTEGKHYPIEKFVRLTQPEYYKDADVCYAQGWAFIYFLMNTNNPRWREIINTYIQTLKEGGEEGELLKRAVDKAFEGVDYAQIDRAFEEFIRNGFKTK